MCKFNFSNHKLLIANYTCLWIILRIALTLISWSTLYTPTPFIMYVCAFVHIRLRLRLRAPTYLSSRSTPTI